MKCLLMLAVVAVLAGCGTPEMSPEEQKVRPVSNTDACRFIKTAYFEVGTPAKIHYYATKNVIDAGGDSYSIMTSGKDRAVGFNINTTTIGIYKCN